VGDEAEARAWQVEVWDRMSEAYRSEVDRRFAPVIERVIASADLKAGERVLDLGTGTGAVAEKAAPAVEPGGSVLAIDISPEMLAQAAQRASQAPVGFQVAEGSAERIPAADASLDVVLASLSLMYVIDRARAAREIARVLRPGGRLVASAWAGPERCDLVLFQETAGRFAPAPPASGVGPGALADPRSFVQELARAGIEAHVETDVVEFDFDDFAAAWKVFAGVTAGMLTPERKQAARAAVQEVMWPDPRQPRRFSNGALFIIGQRH
jgi:SAM-dependent methyltransferase